MSENLIFTAAEAWITLLSTYFSWNQGYWFTGLTLIWCLTIFRSRQLTMFYNNSTQNIGLLQRKVRQWKRVLLSTLNPLVRNFSLSDGTLRSIAVFTRVHHWIPSCARYSAHPNRLFNIHFIIILPTTLRSPRWYFPFWCSAYASYTLHFRYPISYHCPATTWCRVQPMGLLVTRAHLFFIFLLLLPATSKYPA